ncbi:MAG: hypothetical protein ACD_46C00122G0001 [uncultured bacterium]|nr:MAG: hypothetical protein ACD_46C00122G0001 [uncultured bacterium]
MIYTFSTEEKDEATVMLKAREYQFIIQDILDLMRKYDKYGLEKPSDNEEIAQAQSDTVNFIREKIFEIVNEYNYESPL